MLLLTNSFIHSVLLPTPTDSPSPPLFRLLLKVAFGQVWIPECGS